SIIFLFFFQAEDGIRDRNVTGVQTCALPILMMAITKRSIQNRLKELYKRNGLEVTFMTLARGTASNEILDCFGLEATEKLIRFSDRKSVVEGKGGEVRG